MYKLISTFYCNKTDIFCERKLTQFSLLQDLFLKVIVIKAIVDAKEIDYSVHNFEYEWKINISDLMKK